MCECRYWYRFGDPNWGFSRTFSFQAAPRPQDTVHILATADVGQGEEDGSNTPLVGEGEEEGEDGVSQSVRRQRGSYTPLVGEGEER